MTITSLGVGSGIDLNSILTSIYNQSTAQTSTLDKRSTQLSTSISELGKIQSAMDDFKTALNNLGTSSGLNSLSGVALTSSDPTGLSALAGANANGLGDHSVTVSSLASVSRIASGVSVADPTAAVGAGSLTLNLGVISGAPADADGKYTGATFTGSKSASISISSTDNLNDVVTKLNQSGLVNASLISDGTGYRLSIQSAATGSNQSIKIDASGSSSLSDLMQYDPAGTQKFFQTQAAADFKGKVDGISIVNSSNTLTGALAGTTLTASKVGSYTVTATASNTSASTALTNLVSKWNTLNSLVKTDTSYNSTTKVSGPLAGESSLKFAMGQMRSAVFGKTFSTGSSPYSTLMSIGLSVDASGTATLDSAKLQKALTANPNALSALFDPKQGGAAASADAVVKSNSATSQYGLSARIAGMNKSIDALTKQKQQIIDQATSQQKILSAQFSALDKLMSTTTQLSTFLTKTFA